MRTPQRTRSWPLMVLRLAVLVAVVVTTMAAGHEAEFADECQLVDPGGTPTLAVGVVDCLRLPSQHMGAPVPVGYYVPPACDPALGRDCPVLYYTHGTGGSYREGAGAKGSDGNAWVAALTSGPPVDPRTTDEPWRYADPDGWVDRPDLDLIIVAPHGRTLPGGHGPGRRSRHRLVRLAPAVRRRRRQPAVRHPPAAAIQLPGRGAGSVRRRDVPNRRYP